jgi:hypothetical protein
MVDLQKLEEQLNNDPVFRQQFLADPVGVLRRAGLWLSPAQQETLRQELAGITSQRPYIAGTSANVASRGMVRLRVAAWDF